MTKKFIVVTGAAGGFGHATCQLLLHDGYIVFALDKNAIETFEYSNGELIPMQADIINKENIDHALVTIKSHTDCLHGLVNIAGIFDQFPLAEVEDEKFDNLIEANLIGQQKLTKTLFPLLHRGKGRIVNLSSETVLAPMPLQSYGFSKKLFEVWNDQLRLELGLFGIKVIKIRAGGHLTPFIHRSVEVLSAVDEDSLYRNIQLKAKDAGLKILKKVSKDPVDVALVIREAMTAKHPKKVYHINISGIFRLLSLFPAGVREKILIAKMKSWL